jgi:ATP-dependent Clp protease ATP-binding subunit ClpB
VNFRNTVLIMTSNIGSHYLLEGVTSRGEITEDARAKVMAEMRSHFRPEFLNRIDDTVLFKPLRLDEIKKIVGLLAERVRRRLADRKITLEISEAATALIAREGFDPVYGARPLRRFLQHEVETAVARALIAGAARDGSTVRVGEKDGRIDVVVEAPPA